MEIARSTLKRLVESTSRGQLIPIFALGIFVLFAAAALAVDVGYLRYRERAQQTAADAAAMAGATELTYYPSTIASSPPVVTTSARADAGSNGFTHDGSNVIVTVNNPPLSGSYTGNWGAVEVIIDAKHSTFFQQAFGLYSQRLAARAVAVLKSTGGACVLTLGSGNGNVLSMNSTAFNAPSCGFLSNGALSVNGGATITAASIGAVGRISDQTGTFPEASPAPAVAEADPCQRLPGCAYLTNNTPSSTPCMANPTESATSVTYINPGIYCTLVITHSVVFNPGLYVIQGQGGTGFSANSGATISGAGVTFYMAGGKIDANNVPSWNLSAPTTGNYEGVLFYQPPSNTNDSNLNAGGSGSTYGTLAGMLYLPSSSLNSNASFSSYLSIIARNANINGATASIPSTGTPPGSRHAVLGE